MNGHAGGIQENGDLLNVLKFVGRRLIQAHPFKVYILPSVLRTTLAPTTDWRSFRVRAGKYLDTDAFGTDNHDEDPDSEALGLSDVSDIVAPSSVAVYAIWLDVSAPATPTVMYGYAASGLGAGAGGTPTDQGWTSFPIADADHIPIAFIDTDTLSGSKTAIVRQIIRADIVSVGTGSSAYRGTYDPAETYTHGDMVRVLTGASAGVWVCSSLTPITGDDPIWPEPSATGGTNSWDLIAFGPELASLCSGGSKQIYINGTAPF